MLKKVDLRFGEECNHRCRWDGGPMVDETYYLREGETEVECGPARSDVRAAAARRRGDAMAPNARELHRRDAAGKRAAAHQMSALRTDNEDQRAIYCGKL